MQLPKARSRIGRRTCSCRTTTRDFTTPNYGLTKFGDLFTPRQLVALTTFSDLVTEAIVKIKADALAAGLPDDGIALDKRGSGATAYAQAVGVYLAFALSRSNDRFTFVAWDAGIPAQESALAIHLAAKHCQ